MANIFDEQLLNDFSSLKKPQTSEEEKIKQAQEQRDKMNTLLTALQGAQQVGAGIASGYGGQVPKTDLTALRKQAEQPLLDLKEMQTRKEEHAARKMYTDILKKQVPNLDIDKDVSTEHLKGLIGNFNKAQKSFQQSQYMTTTGDPISFNPANNSYVNTLTGEPIQSGKVIRNYVKTITDPRTGEIVEVRPGIGIAKNLTPPKTGKSKEEASKKKTSKDIYNSLVPTDREQLDDIRSEFVKETKDQRESIGKVEAIIGEGLDLAVNNPIANSQLGARVATIFENGRLTDEDVLRYTRRRGITDKLQDFIRDMYDGTANQEKIDFIRETLQTFAEDMRTELKKRAEQKATDVSNRLLPNYNSKELIPLIYSNPPAIEKARIQLPDGRTGVIPRQNLNEAIKRGAKEIK